MILSALIVSILFSVIPWVENTAEYKFFPFFHGHGEWKGEITFENYIYGHCEHAAWVCVLVAFYFETGKKFYKIWAWLEFLDAVDYALTFNTAWFSIPTPWGGFGVEYNYFKFFTIMYLANKEYGTSE